jgi:large subunit ribosomal protein L5
LNTYMEFYEKEVKSAMIRRFQYKNVMEVPKLVKITLNIGLGEALQNIKALDAASGDVKAITGQKPVITKAKKSIASFKLREGMSVGCMVTLRRERMYEFYRKLVTIVLPRVRDFKGVSPKSFDGRGNYTLGLKEQIIFPEIEYDKIDKLRGMNISITTTAKTDEEAKALLAAFRFPFRN